MNIELEKLTVIIQAGGRGSRLRHHTWNKPKCLVSVRGKPILYHALEHFKNAHFIIIGDYLFEQIEKYLKINPPGVSYELVHANEKGTSAGLKESIEKVNPKEPVLLLWSDLIIHKLPDFSRSKNPVVFTTAAFTCRWSVSPNDELHEKPDSTRGVPGIFYFPCSEELQDVPVEGEFVRWYSSKSNLNEYIQANDIEELGDFVTIEGDNERAGFCRFFNQVEINDDLVTKKVINSEYRDVHEKEKQWYKEVKNLGFRRIPEIISYNPLQMKRITGHHIFQIKDLTKREQRSVLADYVDSLLDLHDRVRVPVRRQEVSDVYIQKTLNRIESVYEIIPHTQKAHMTINGKKCRNFYHEKYRDIFTNLLSKITPEYFCSIHGDPTYSNTLVDDKLRVWYIDPRGYFSKPGIVGDGWYDFAKLYYSAIGGYDAFNRKKFKLHVDEDTVEILIEEPLYKDSANDILKEYFKNDLSRIEIIHSLIWFSLSGYVIDDIDSIIGAYYYGNYWLETALEKI